MAWNNPENWQGSNLLKNWWVQVKDNFLHLLKRINGITSNETLIQNSEGGFAAGENAIAGEGVALGKDAKASIVYGYISPGQNTATEQPLDAIQLGTGRNISSRTMQVYNKRIVESNGSLTDVGNLSELETEEKSSVVKAINYLNTTKADKGSVDELNSAMSDVKTTINGISDNIGDLSDLPTFYEINSDTIAGALYLTDRHILDLYSNKQDYTFVEPNHYDNVNYELKFNKELRCDTITSLNITLPSFKSDVITFISSVVFTSGETPTALVYPQSITMSGEDCIDGVFVPVKNKRYTVIVSYDGVYYSGVVGGVKI